MKLTVKNFGPIKKAENIDVSPLTIFVGPSNTGKSYLAMLIYITAKVLEEEKNRIMYFPVQDIYEALRKKGSVAVKKIISNDKEFAKFSMSQFSKFITFFHRLWKNEALRCFGKEWENIIGQNATRQKALDFSGQGDASISVVVSDDDEIITLDLLSPERDRFSQMDSMMEDMRRRILSSFIRDHNEDIPTIDLPKLAYSIASGISNLFDFLPGVPQSGKNPHDGFIHKDMNEAINTHYLPAVRGGLMQSHRILVSSLVEKAPTIGLTGAEIIPFTGVLADFLQKLLNAGTERPIPSSSRRQGAKNIAELSREIERKLIHGEIKTKMLETHYPDFRYRFTDKSENPRDISLMYASSSVSELAPIILFIRYYLSPGDVFIVEEPEAHLHPEAQRVIADVLVELANAGVRVIATTHSDIILEQIGNFIHADKIPQAKVLDKQAKGRTLSKDRASVYRFDEPERGKGVAVRAIPFDEETGILTKDHLDVSSDLYNETASLLNARNADMEKSQ